MKRILYISIGAFWNNSIMANYKHHDLIFKYLNKIDNIEVKIGVPVQGPSYLKKLLSGNKDHVQKVWRESIPFSISSDLCDGEFDVMIINGSENFLDLETPDGLIESKRINDYVIDKCYECVRKGIPIILFDQDNYINERVGSKDGSTNLTYNIFRQFKDYNGFYLTGPFMYCPVDTYMLSNKYITIPFVVDPEDKDNLINPLSQRNYVTKYAGNNFFRENFIPYFIECSKYGKVLVRGSKWKPFARDNKDNENLEVKPKFPLYAEKVNEFYGDSKIGLYGTTTIPSFSENGHFTLRIREFFDAGIFIIPENKDYMKNTISFKNITVNDLSNLDKYISISDFAYEELVKNQRDKILNFFNAEDYAKIINELI